MKNTLIFPKNWRDRWLLRLRGYIRTRPSGVDEIEKCPSCGAKAYGKGKTDKSRTYNRDAYKVCAACGFNPRFGPQGPPPETLIEQHPVDVTKPLAVPR